MTVDAPAVAVALLAAVAAALVVWVRPRIAVESVGRRPAPWRWGPVAMAAVVIGSQVADARWTALGAIAVAAAVGVRWLSARRSAAAMAESAGVRATEFCEAIAAELTSGAPPTVALESAATDFPEFVAAATVGRMGGDVPAAIRDLARGAGLADLRLVAAAWQVSQRSGSGMADALERAGATLRARRRVGRLVAAELASARATARIMAALPVVFALAGAGLGADPIGFLTRGAIGISCLAAGLALTWLGLAWLQRIADRVSG